MTEKTAVDALPFTLELLPLNEVHEAKNNAKLHSQSQVTAIIRSIKEFGFRDPIAVDASGEIVEGHGRVLALRHMGATKVPALVFKDMTADQVRAYRIAHNQLTLSTGFDIKALSTELRDLELSGFDLELTGFGMADLESFELQLDLAPAQAPAVVTAPATPEQDAPGAEADPVQLTAPGAPTYQYVMIFDDKAQHARFTNFIKHLKANVEGETIAERFDTFLKSQGH